MRFADIHNDKIVFSYTGDLWLAKVPREAKRGAPPTPALSSSQVLS